MLCVPYLGGRIYSDRTVRTGHVVSVVSDRTVRTGYVVSVVCSICWVMGCVCVFHNRVLGSNIVIGLYIQGMWSVLCVPYVGGRI